MELWVLRMIKSSTVLQLMGKQTSVIAPVVPDIDVARAAVLNSTPESRSVSAMNNNGGRIDVKDKGTVLPIFTSNRLPIVGRTGATNKQYRKTNQQSHGITTVSRIRRN